MYQLNCKVLDIISIMIIVISIMIIVYKQNDQLQIIKFQDRFRWASFMSIGCQWKRQKDDRIEFYNKNMNILKENSLAD